MHIKVPGKLMLAGEWGVLEEGNSCIVMAIDKYVTASIKKTDTFVITSSELTPEKIEFIWQNKKLKVLTSLKVAEQEKFLFVKSALEITLSYLEETRSSVQPFSLFLQSDHTLISLRDGSLAKVGFGSSAAVVVAVIKALLMFHGYQFQEDSKEVIFKLACIAHYKAQDNRGSGFDIAASVYEKTLLYTRFDALWLMRKLKKIAISVLVHQKWPSLHIMPLSLPSSLMICVGFVGVGVSTKDLIVQMSSFKEQYPVRYKYLCSSINTIVHDLVQAFQENEQEKILALIKQNKQTLRHLSQESGIDLETGAFKLLIEDAEKFGAASKFSGSGGGDCGIAVCFDKQVALKVVRKWEKDGFYLINAQRL